MPPHSGDDRSGAGGALTVATFNVRNSRACDGTNSWILRRRATAAAIAALGADVVGLQEVFRRPLAYLLRSLRDHDGYGEARAGGGRGERCTILVPRGRFDVLASRTSWFGDAPQRPGTRLPGAGFPRVATMVKLRDRAASCELDVWNVHLDERSAANRARSTAQLATWIQPDTPTIVMGDFNAVPGDEEVFAPLGAARLRSTLGTDAPGTAHDFTGRTDVPRLDHILVSPHWQVEGANVVTTRPKGRLPSDHWPVVATLRLTEDARIAR
jgi:endonuclease/exonuclease/phosphatase family metal-dependent hydrolase